MNKMFLILSFAAGVANAATHLEYNCGKSFGADVSLTISDSSSNGAFDLEAKFVGPGKDPVTGTFLRSHEIKLEGRLETMNPGTAKAQEIYIFNEIGNPFYQLAVEKEEHNKKTYELLVIDARERNEMKMTCSLVRTN